MFRLTVEDVFAITGRGTVATGKVEEGSVRVGDTVAIDGREVTLDGVEMFRKVVDQANAGDNVGLLFKSLGRDDVQRGAVITGTGEGFSTTTPTTSAPLAADQLEAMQDAGLAEKPKRRWFGR